MELETLKSLLDTSRRQELFDKILKTLEELDKIENISYKAYEISEGIIPIVKIGNESNFDKIKNVFLFVGAQHNEYNGLFGILEFLNSIKNDKEILNQEDQILLFAPLMNPHGFIKPTKFNKSGYFLKNGLNLNRIWRRTFIPDYNNKDSVDSYRFKIPEHAYIIKNLLIDYWDNENIKIHILDMHETSLLYRFPRELSLELKEKSFYYKFDHWLKESIIRNILEIYNIKHLKPLFTKCNASAKHSHINLSIAQIDTVFEKLLDYMVKNQNKLAFYFCYNPKSEKYCKNLANAVYKSLENILWETNYPAYSHYFHDHGCFVKMNETTTRKNLYCMELENQKQFFNIFEEFEKSKVDPQYFEKKLAEISLTIKLVVETITQMITLSD